MEGPVRRVDSIFVADSINGLFSMECPGVAAAFEEGGIGEVDFTARSRSPVRDQVVIVGDVPARTGSHRGELQ